MLEDIVTAPILVDKMEKMNKVLMDQDEWHYISMDATLKLCMKLMGQASYRAPQSVRNEAPFGDDVAWRRLLTIRGRTGAVLLMHPLQNESSEHVVDALVQNFSADQLRSVVHIGTDQPSEKLFSQLKEICPSMRSLLLDPIHLAIVYSECQKLGNPTACFQHSKHAGQNQISNFTNFFDYCWKFKLEIL